jgi:Protein of unknown function (DUF669)
MSELSTTLDEAFNTQTEEGTPDLQPLPAGNYLATIVDAKVGPLKSGKGQAVLLQWEVQGGANQGRLIFDRVIVAHESAEAMKFGRRKLKDIADACGVKDSITDLTVLLNKPCSIYVKIEQDDAGEYPPKNRVGRIKPIAASAKTNGGKPAFNDQIPF